MIKKLHRETERGRVREQLPLPAAVVRALFDHIDRGLTSSPCDHTLRFTQTFIAQHHLPEMQILDWLRNNGGYCDCEVLYNVEEKVNDALGEGDD